MRRAFLVLSILGLSFFILPETFAKSGCCSHHDGVCCSCGPQSNGRVICNDGWKGSSCHYSEMVKCGGYSTPSPAPVPTLPVVPVSPPKPTCPANSTYSSLSTVCVCNSGYAKSLSGKYCVKIPEHAHAVESLIDVWSCDEGYEEAGNTCVETIEEIGEVVEQVVEEVNMVDVFPQNAEVPSEENTPTEPENVPVLERTEKSEVEEDTSKGSILTILTLLGFGWAYLLVP